MSNINNTKKKFKINDSQNQNIDNIDFMDHMFNCLHQLNE